MYFDLKCNNIMGGLRKILFLILALLVFSFAYSQDKKMRRADEIYEAGEYYRAITEYTKILRKEKNKNTKNELYFKIGDCYFNIGDYKKARSNYRRTIKVRSLEIDSKIRLAEIQIQEGTYDEAIEIYQDVLEMDPNDTIAQKGIESANLAKIWSEQPSRFKVEKMKEFNTKRNDFSPTVDEKDGYDHVYFSSNRDEAKGKKTSFITGEKFSDLYVSKFDRKQKWSDPVPLDSLNSIYDEGTPTIVDGGRKFYYTACKAEKGRKVGCQIYEAQKVDGEWMNPTKLDLVDDSLSIGHPTVSPDGNRIYFSGRLQGGFGGADIWYCENEDGNWSKPKNMGPAINSPGDELFPFMRNDSTFFYSSTKHPTMGGLDIFIATKNEKGRWVSENMKPPFNSNGNDFGIYYYSNQDKGFFTSDRKGSKQEDIYWFEKPPLVFSLSGIAKDKDTEVLLDSCAITLFGSDGSIFRDTTSIADKERKGHFKFKLKAKTDYAFMVQKQGYFNGKARFTTDSVEFDKVFEYEILLEPLNKTFEIPNIEFEFGRWDLTESSKHTLDSITKIMVDNPYLVIELSAHTDMIGSDAANMELSQKRANSVVEYFTNKGIPNGRLVPKGYGESKPKVILKPDIKYPFLPKGAILSEDYILTLSPEQQVVANQQNRRIEMRVISNDFIPSLD